MKRREFLAGLCGAALARPFAAAAEPGQPARIGFISALDEELAAVFLRELRSGLKAHGYAEPGTITIEQAYAHFDLDRIPALVAEMERKMVSLIVTHANAVDGVVACKRSVPVIYEFSADPATLGIAADLAHPLHNSTGITLMMAELNSKRLELISQIVPNVRRIAVLANALHPGVELERTVSETNAKQLGLDTSFLPTRNKEELERALDDLDKVSPQAILLFSDAFIVEHRRRILDFAMSRRLPVVSGWAVMAESGALCTYGPRLVESYRRVAYFVDRMLKGAKPAEIPIEQPTVLELVVNLSSAKALGITIPSTVLVRADRVID